MHIEHIAFRVGSKEAVDALADRLKRDGYPVVSGPRTTGDGYYESCIIGVEGNQIEITVQSMLARQSTKDEPEMPCEKQVNRVIIREKAMNVLVVYCHPSENSFTSEVKNSFVKGLEEAGHTYTISDLYAEGFNPVMSKEEYHREGFYQLDMPVFPDL